MQVDNANLPRDFLAQSQSKILRIFMIHPQRFLLRAIWSSPNVFFYFDTLTALDQRIASREWADMRHKKGLENE